MQNKVKRGINNILLQVTSSMNKVRKWQHKLLAQFFSCQGSCQSVLCPCGFPKSALCLCLVCQCLLDSLQHRSTRLAWFCIWAPWGYQQFPSCNPTLYFFRLLVIVYPIYDTMCLHIVLQVYHKCELPGGDTADLRFAYRFSLSLRLRSLKDPISSQSVHPPIGSNAAFVFGPLR